MVYLKNITKTSQLHPIFCLNALQGNWKHEEPFHGHIHFLQGAENAVISIFGKVSCFYDGAPCDMSKTF